MANAHLPRTWFRGNRPINSKKNLRNSLGISLEIKTRWRCNTGQPIQRLFFQQLVAEAIIKKCFIWMQILKRFLLNVSQEAKVFVFLYFLWISVFLYYSWHTSFLVTKSILSHGLKLLQSALHSGAKRKNPHLQLRKCQKAGKKLVTHIQAGMYLFV